MPNNFNKKIILILSFRDNQTLEDMTLKAEQINIERRIRLKNTEYTL